MQFRVLRHPRLYEQRCPLRVDAGGKPVDQHVPDVGIHLRRLLVVGREGMPVGNKVKALGLFLQPDPVLEHPVVMAKVKPAGRPHTGKDSPGLNVKRHGKNQTALTAYGEGPGLCCQ